MFQWYDFGVKLETALEKLFKFSVQGADQLLDSVIGQSVRLPPAPRSPRAVRVRSASGCDHSAPKRLPSSCHEDFECFRRSQRPTTTSAENNSTDRPLKPPGSSDRAS